MELTILERLMLVKILPQESNIVTIKIVEDLKSEAAFSEEEIEEHNLEMKDGGVYWSQDSMGFVKDIPLGPQAMKVIIESLEKLNNEEKLTADFITLYEKFMDTTE